MRRLTLLLALLVISTTARAADFDWTHPGADPYRGSVDRALTLLASGNLIPSAALQGLRDKVRDGGCYHDTIPDGFRITRMLFGNGVLAPNVVAHTSQWPDTAQRTAEICEYRDRGGKLYVLLRPDVCGNWSLRIVSIQGECVLDTLLCDGECEKLRAHQR